MRLHRRFARLGLVAGGIVSVSVAASCVSSRDRIDIPTVHVLEASDTVIDGRHWVIADVASDDHSGLLRLRVTVSSVYDTLRQTYQLFNDQHVEQFFVLPRLDTIPAGTEMLVVAEAIDNQDFTVTDTVTVTSR
jgi:hypothetical protein